MEEVAHEICSTLCCSYCPFKNHAVSNCMDSLLKWLDTQQTKDIKQLCGMLREEEDKC